MRASGLLHCVVRPRLRSIASAVRSDEETCPIEKEQHASQNNEADDPHDDRDPQPFPNEPVETASVGVFTSELLEAWPLGPPVLGGDGKSPRSFEPPLTPKHVRQDCPRAEKYNRGVYRGIRSRIDRGHGRWSNDSALSGRPSLGCHRRDGRRRAAQAAR